VYTNYDAGTFQVCSQLLSLEKTLRRQAQGSCLKIDVGSEWANWATPQILLREGKTSEARDAVKKVPSTARYYRDLLEAAVRLRLPAELNRIASEKATLVAGGDDPETSYQQGSILAFAGKDQAARHLIRIAIESNYCAYSALMNDPLLANLRSLPDFMDLLKAALLCQEPVLAQRNSNTN